MQIYIATCRVRGIWSSVVVRSVRLLLWTTSCSLSHTLRLTIFTRPKPVVAAFTAAVVELLTVT